MVKLWELNAARKFCTVIDDVDFDILDGVPFLRGTPLLGQFPVVDITVKKKTPINDFIQAGSLFIVSHELKSFLEERHVHAEFLRVKVMAEGSNDPLPNKSFYFMNMLDIVDCLDYENSEYRIEKLRATELVKVSELVIDEKKAKGYPLFRLKVGHLIYCASDSLAQEVEEAGFTGMEFVPPSMWKRR